MREPSKLADAVIQAALQTHYGLNATALTFLPIGNDSASFVYGVDAIGGTSYFLKVRTDAGFSPASLAVPHFLHEQGVPHIVPPLSANSGRLWIDVGDFALSLYPFIDARTATATGLSDRHWHALGATFHQIHTSQLPPDLQQIVPHETFVPSRRHVLANLDSVIANRRITDPIQQELADFWHSQQDQIHAVIDRADTLGNLLRQASLLALCHADAHTWNVLLDTTQQMWIVDWDEVVLAPKERDLMFFIGGIAQNLVNLHETSCFLQGYGNPAIDHRALVYYRYAWAVQEMGAYAEEGFFGVDRSEQARRDAVRALVDLFAPGNIVAIACASDSDMLGDEVM